MGSAQLLTLDPVLPGRLLRLPEEGSVDDIIRDDVAEMRLRQLFLGGRKNMNRQEKQQSSNRPT